MNGAEQNNSAMPLRTAHRHEHSFTDCRSTFVQARVGDVHAGQLADQRLIFEERLQAALTGLSLVRSVSGVKLAATSDRVYCRRNKVVVNPATEKTRSIRRSHISRCQFSNQLLKFQFGKLRRNIEWPFELQRLGNLVEQGFHRFNANRFEHFPLLVRRVEEVTQQNLRM